MTALDRLGLEVAAFILLGSRGRASLLMALIEGRGTTVCAETLKNARAWKMPHFEDCGPDGVRVRISRLREAMEDVGLPDLIETRGGNAYALPEPGRSAVIDRLIAEALA